MRYEIPSRACPALSDSRFSPPARLQIEISCIQFWPLAWALSWTAHQTIATLKPHRSEGHVAHALGLCRVQFLFFSWLTAWKMQVSRSTNNLQIAGVLEKRNWKWIDVNEITVIKTATFGGIALCQNEWPTLRRCFEYRQYSFTNTLNYLVASTS